jgi:peroxiredoxin
MKRVLLATTALVLMFGWLCAIAVQPGLADGLSGPKIGDQIKNFTLKDYNGKEHSLYDVKGKKAVVVMFIATQCPVSNAYNERMVKLVDDYRSKGVEFIAINSNKQESVEEVAKHAAKNKFNFPVLKDPDNVIADYFAAAVTPEIYVLDPKWTLLYHGRIDDKQKVNEVTSQDLRAALDAVLAGKEVPKKETKAFGCTIKRVAKKPVE